MPKESRTRDALRPGRVKLAIIQRRLTEEKVAHYRDNTTTRVEAIADVEKLIACLERVLRKNATILPWRFPAGAMPLIYQTPALLHAELKEHCRDASWSVKLIALPGED